MHLPQLIKCGCGMRSAPINPLIQKFLSWDSLRNLRHRESLPTFLPTLPQSLTPPTPDKTADQHIVCIEQIPVILEVTQTVPHRMRILIQQERLAGRIRAMLLLIARFTMFALADRLALQCCCSQAMVGYVWLSISAARFISAYWINRFSGSQRCASSRISRKAFP